MSEEGPTESATETVTTLLKTAGITVSESELTKLAGLYPAVRAQADGLYLAELESVDPALSFDPAGT